MKTYSRAARLFIYSIWLGGLMAAIASTHFAAPDFTRNSPWLLGLILIIAFVSGSQTVTLARSKQSSERYCISLGFFICIYCLLVYGGRICVAAAFISALGSCIYPKRLPWLQSSFNIAALVLTAAVTALTYTALQTGPLPARCPQLLQVLLAAGVYFLINSVCLSTILALCAAGRFRKIWASLFWTCPSYLAGASFALLLSVFFSKDGSLLALVPVLAFVQKSYQTHMDKLEESRRHLEQRERDIEELHQSRQALADLYTSTVQSLACAIDAKDQSTHAHILGVQKVAVSMAQQLGIEGDDLEAIRTGAVLHDIGKLGVPDHILLKPGPLTEAEFRQIQQHCRIGAEILAPVNFPWPAISVVKHHHEHWDGTGYPDGLAGTDIPIGARIVHVADVYDALTSARPYRPAWSVEEAIHYIREQSGTQFDPEVVDALVQILAQAAAGGAVVAVDRDVIEHSEYAVHSIQQSTTKSGVLYDVLQLLNTRLPLEERLELVCERIIAALPDTDCMILRYDVCAPGQGCDRHEAQSPVQPTPPERIMRLVACAGPRRDDLSREALYGAEGMATRFQQMTSAAEAARASFLVQPLNAGGEEIGAMGLYHPVAGMLSEDERYLLQVVAAQVQRDLADQLQFERTRDEAQTDVLTGLYNIRYLIAAMQTPAAVGVPPLTAPYSVLYLDLDNFKPINDHFGHGEGNSVLQDIALLLQRTLRPTDQIIRYGGDEFVVILPHTSYAESDHIARRLREAVESYRFGRTYASGEEVRLDVSIGIACCPTDGRDLHALVTLADQRMYAQKATRKRPDRSAYAVVNTASVEEPATEHTT